MITTVPTDGGMTLGIEDDPIIQEDLRMKSAIDPTLPAASLGVRTGESRLDLDQEVLTEARDRTTALVETHTLVKSVALQLYIVIESGKGA